MPNAASSSAPLTPGEQVAQHPVTAYTLTPQQLHRAKGLHRTGLAVSLASSFLGVAVLAAFVAARLGPKLQRVAESISQKRLLQAATFVPALLLSYSFFQLPLEVYGHHISLAYGLSVQGWLSWTADLVKSGLLTILFATLTLWGLYTLIRHSPRRWWFYGWLLTVAIMAGMVFLSPILIDPLFNRFEPLARTNPELTEQLRSLAHSAGVDIPTSRIFLMHASDKVTTYNAYVTGFGATKRIVVWDTTARDLTLPQILFVFGHELGHYKLHHIYLGLAFGALLTFAGFWLLQRLAEFALRRHGPRWGLRSLREWSSLPLLMLIASVLLFLGTPLANTFSRWEEHQADAYGLAITRPVTADAGQVAAQAFQLLGEKSYSYPNPSPLLVFWSYSHPPIAQRIQFALTGK